MKELTLALANQARQNVGVVVNYTPNRQNDVRRGVIKAVVIDWRSYTVMYRIEDLESGKNCHKVVDSTEVELTTERRETSKRAGASKESMEAKLQRLMAQQEALQKQLAELQGTSKKSSK